MRRPSSSTTLSVAVVMAHGTAGHGDGVTQVSIASYPTMTMGGDVATGRLCPDAALADSPQRPA